MTGDTMLAAVHNRKTRYQQAEQHATILHKLSARRFQDVYASANPAKE